MALKKACIIFTTTKEVEAEATAAQLRDNGYSVCMAEVTAEVGGAVKAGDQASLPAEVADCLQDAEVCIILIDETGDLGAIGGLASDRGCRVVTVGGSPDDLPQELEDIIDGHAPSLDAPELMDVVKGEPERIKSGHEPAPGRKPDRVKCQ